MSAIDPRITDRIRGPAWSQVRDTFCELCDTVLNAGPNTRADLTTIYVKFTLADDPSGSVYAVAWIKSAKNVVIGFALPESVNDVSLVSAPTGMMYKGITKYYRLVPEAELSPTVSEWARIAFEQVTAGRNHDDV